MKRSALFLTVLFALFSISMAQNDDELTAPPQPWYIGRPVFNSTRLDLFLEYPVSDYIPYDHLDFRLYDSRACGGEGNSGDITENNYLDVTVSHDGDTGRGDGDFFRYVKLGFKFDPETIRESPIIQYAGLETKLQFCVRFSAYSAPIINPRAVELIFKETFVTLDIKQFGELDVDFVVVPDEMTEEFAEQVYTLIGYICDTDNNIILNPEPIFQGQPTRVCVTPTEDALADGVYMRAIDSFFWTRGSIFQTAISSHQTAAPLTDIECVAGSEVCAFTTILKAGFFFKRGDVIGAGLGWLQFGRSPFGRAMRANIVMFEPRQANSPVSFEPRQSEFNNDGVEFGGQGTHGYAGGSPFSVIRPVTRLYEAIGFLCNSQNQELDPAKHPLTRGDIARVCVKPNDLALKDDVRIRAIDSFTWRREDIDRDQDAVIPNEQEAQKTTIFCTPGNIVCAFETLLDDEYYGTAGVVDGSGIVWLQFGGERRRVQFDLGFELLPDMDPGFAGASPFSTFVYVLPPPELRELYSCFAYECDEYNNPIVPTGPKMEGDIVKMCVAPSYEAQQVGVKMWAVEWWDYTQQNITQTAVAKQAKEGRDGRTLLMCKRGMDVCSFTTRLIPNFFGWPSAMSGVGHCWLTFGVGFDDEQTSEDVPEGTEIDPTGDPLYAGGNDIGISWPTTGDWKDVVVCPSQDHQLKVWWQEEDDNMRLLYTLAMIGLGTGLCCLYGLCLFCNRRDSREVEEAGGNVIINVDLEDKQHIQNHIENHVETEKDHLIDLEDDATWDTNGRSTQHEPTDHDVCFGKNRHPGTEKCRSAVRKYIRRNEEASFGPHVFEAITDQLNDRTFFVQDRKNSSWREARKSEIISSLSEMWREEKKKLKTSK